MSLTLTLVAFKNRAITDINAVVIDDEGGSIGRSDDNVLVLPCPEKFVSRHHATIKMENGYYYLADTSLSGIIVNDELPPLKNATQRLDNGAHLKIGEYEIIVTISQESVIDTSFESLQLADPAAYVPIDMPWEGIGEGNSNSLFADTDNFPDHDELIHKEREYQPGFQSDLSANPVPPSEYFIPQKITPPKEGFTIDELLSASAPESPAQSFIRSTKYDDYEAHCNAILGGVGVDNASLTSPSEMLTENADDTDGLVDSLNNNELFTDSSVSPPVTDLEESIENNYKDSNVGNPKSLLTSSHLPPLNVTPEQPVIIAETDSKKEREIKITAHTVTESSPEKKTKTLSDNALINAFLQGAEIECKEIDRSRQAETLHRIGQMFRKLIDGTVTVLRSRSEFKSQFRLANMTTFKATASDNNPLKFTSTDEVLLRLVENKTDQYLSSAAAIEEAFTDIMNHQLAMQAGIQASLTDILKTFDPKVIEKQFSQGLVLQKKAKCWDSYGETYRDIVEDAVENIFGETFVRAYEKQMKQLKNARKR